MKGWRLQPVGCKTIRQPSESCVRRRNQSFFSVDTRGIVSLLPIAAIIHGASGSKDEAVELIEWRLASFKRKRWLGNGRGSPVPYRAGNGAWIIPICGCVGTLERRVPSKKS